MDALDKDIQNVTKKLRAVKGVFTEEQYKLILAKGAAVARDAVRNEAPISKERHVIKDDGGKTKKVKPGNLRKSIQVFSFKRSNAVFAGAVTSRKSKVKKVGNYKLTRRFRAFYWKFVYYGTIHIAPNKFIDRAREKARGEVIATIKRETEKLLPKKLKNIFNQ